jgi:hypothetical protein
MDMGNIQGICVQLAVWRLKCRASLRTRRTARDPTPDEPDVDLRPAPNSKGRGRLHRLLSDAQHSLSRLDALVGATSDVVRERAIANGLPGGLRRARIRPYRVDPHALALRDPGLTGSYAIATTLADLTSHRRTRRRAGHASHGRACRTE